MMDPVQLAIWHCLNNYAYQDAIFLAERLHAQDPTSQEALHLLGTTYYRSSPNDCKLQAYDLLKNHFKSTNNLNYKNKFLLATVAWELDKLTESETILTNLNLRPLEYLEKHYLEVSAFALKLYGKICVQTDRLVVAREAFQKSLKLNPFLWDAFELVCKFNNNNNNHHGNGAAAGGGGGSVDPNKIFVPLETPHVLGNHSNNHNHHNYENYESVSRFGTPLLNERVTTTTTTGGILHPTNRNNNTRNNNNNNRCHRNLFTSTPMNNIQLSNNSINNSPQLLLSLTSSSLVSSSENSSSSTSPLPPTSSSLHLHPTSSELILSNSNSSASVAHQHHHQQQDTSSSVDPPRSKKPCLRLLHWKPQQQQAQAQQTQVRRSSRLIFSNNSSGGGGGGGNGGNQHLKENTKSPTTSNLKPTTPTTTTTNKKNKNDKLDWLVVTLRELGEGYVHLTRYECKEAIEILTNLKSPQQQNTPWVLATIAKAFFELSLYEKAVGYYKEMRLQSPHGVFGLEWMSTALWHLQREVDLSVLAQDLLAEPSNRHKPQTWILLGNCFSLQKEHEHAIRFFKRAIQVCGGSFAYAYTLLGHEYVSCEELEKALRCFRSASRLDSAHYNSWYGMGMIYYKQERYAQAEVYYKKALSIHPNNSVLLCHLGVVENALSSSEKSLLTFDRALLVNPADPLCIFHRASVLFAINRLDEALGELQLLLRIVPKESLVHFLIAKIHSKKGDTHKALLHFSWATDLDPKGANNHIKESIQPVLSRSNTL